MQKPCIVPAPTTVKLPHASGHYSCNRQGHVTKTKTHRFEIFVALRLSNVWFILDSWHRLYIFSYYHSFNGMSSLANYMAKLLWEWKPRFAISLVVRGLLIVTSHINCDVTSCPVIMRRNANADGDEQRYKTSKTQVSLAFCKILIVVEYKLNAHMVCAVVVGTASGSTTAGTTRAVPDCSTNHSSVDRIVVNSYNHLLAYLFTRDLSLVSVIL